MWSISFFKHGEEYKIWDILASKTQQTSHLQLTSNYITDILTYLEICF